MDRCSYFGGVIVLEFCIVSIGGKWGEGYLGFFCFVIDNCMELTIVLK